VGYAHWLFKLQWNVFPRAMLDAPEQRRAPDLPGQL